MPKQDFDVIDYCGPLVVAAIFAVVLFVLSFFIINFFCITKYDDITQFERFGAKHGKRLGPHSLRVIRQGNFIMKADFDDDDY